MTQAQLNVGVALHVDSSVLVSLPRSAASIGGKQSPVSKHKRTGASEQYV